MLKRKQYLYTLIGAIIAFLLFFIVAYLIVSLQMPDPNAGTAVTKDEQSTSTLVEIKEEVPRIEIYTKVTMEILDEGHKVIERLPIAATTLLGMDEQSIKKRFKDYEVIKFSDREVCLQKVTKQSKVMDDTKKYVLMSNPERQIYVKNSEDDNDITLLNLSPSSLPKQLPDVLSNKGIPISVSEKEKLIKRPTEEIDRILQRCEED